MLLILLTKLPMTFSIRVWLINSCPLPDLQTSLFRQKGKIQYIIRHLCSL